MPPPRSVPRRKEGSRCVWPLNGFVDPRLVPKPFCHKYVYLNLGGCLLPYRARGTVWDVSVANVHQESRLSVHANAGPFLRKCAARLLVCGGCLNFRLSRLSLCLSSATTQSFSRPSCSQPGARAAFFDKVAADRATTQIDDGCCPFKSVGGIWVVTRCVPVLLSTCAPQHQSTSLLHPAELGWFQPGPVSAS